jgi:ComF family protein
MSAGIETVAAKVWRGLIDLVFPPVCVVCREEVDEPGSLCAACWKEVHFLDGPVCAACGLPFEVDPGGDTLCAACLAHPPAFDKARAVMRYDENSKKPILALKHADRLELVPGFARWLERAGAMLLDETDIVVPVPLHRWRLWRRRYNQSAELARILARGRVLAFRPDILLRLRPTPSQGEMPSAKARRRNVRAAFVVPRETKALVAGKTVLLIDDVMTTGATLDACAKTLKRAGAKTVYALALARVVRAPEGAI